MEETKKFKVRFSVVYEVEIDCKESDLQDEIANLSIPEYDQTRYVEDSFEFKSSKEVVTE